MLDVQHRFEIVPQQSMEMGGTKRAILIGINYTGRSCVVIYYTIIEGENEEDK